MEYKGYFGKVEFDDEANIFYGEVLNPLRFRIHVSEVGYN
jgi:predicted HicB family RNase H-like nuclease